MLPFRLTILFVSLSALLGVVVVFACGPFFGIEALQDRKQTLLAAPSVSFEKELASLGTPPKDKLTVAEFAEWDDKKITRESLEAGELPARALARITSMRAATDGDAAYALGDGLAPAIRQYTSGAVSFLHGNTAQAQAHFQAILDLPPADRKNRELWAHFMLGRVAAQANDAPTAKTQFEATRALALSGMPDPLGLAVASFGEQARVDWERGAIASAVNLYAQQASYGSHVALDSLLTVANLILKDKDLLDKAIEDPLTRRLIFTSINKNNGETFFVGPEPSDDALTAKPSGITADILVAALQTHHLTRVAGAGLLASAAYHEGLFDLAEKLSAMEDVPISAWVKAKLALRKGDSQSALTQYEKALKGYEGTGMEEGLRLLRAENGVLRVSRGDYARALDLFYSAAQGDSGFRFSDYWGDAAYLAERVLTIDELRSYIDGNVPVVAIPEKKKGEEDQNAYQLPASVHLRSLLARRLMRAGKRSEALRYFEQPTLRSAAEEYSKALDKAASWWRWRSTRAEAWYTAAKLARTQGLEILGFEKEPDFAMWDGEFSSDYINKEPSFQNDDERKRVAASAPEKDVRFQYRLTAVDEAMKSADLLPHSSQAFAAVLCEGSSWVIDRYPERAADLYHRYIHQGPHVAWATTFARTCPAPDFSAASTWTFNQTVKKFEKHAKAHRLLTGVIDLTTVVALAAIIYFARRAFAHRTVS
jgi:tetratricopeptide (TPR) repeat protein